MLSNQVDHPMVLTVSTHNCIRLYLGWWWWGGEMGVSKSIYELLPRQGEGPTNGLKKARSDYCSFVYRSYMLQVSE